MDNEIQLISDGDGLAVIGDPAGVERFLAAEGLESPKDLGLPRLRSVLGTGSAVAQADSGIAAGSGRWVKLTEESAQLTRKYGLTEKPETGLKMGVVHAKGQAGLKAVLEFGEVPGALLTNPAILAGAAGVMAQFAMQQTMDEILDYLATINEKVDDVLRAQQDAVLADMIGVGLVIDEAMTIRERVGRVSEVTWSKVQGTSATIARTQAYALRQIDAIAEKAERKKDIGDLAETAREAESKVGEWLAVLARCFQLQDAVAVLELDRVLDSAPDELDRHRLGLKAARQDRLELIARCTGTLLERLEAAAGLANDKVLFHPLASPAVVQSSNHIAVGVHDFRGRLGIESGHQSSEAKRWLDEAAKAANDAIETGAKGVDAAGRLGLETLGQARSATDKLTGKLSGEIAGRLPRWPRGGEQSKELPESEPGE